MVSVLQKIPTNQPNLTFFQMSININLLILSDVVSLPITKNDNHVVPMWSTYFISTTNVKVVSILNITYLFQPQNNKQNNSF